jgi:lysophospholipase L1-like esterase
LSPSQLAFSYSLFSIYRTREKNMKYVLMYGDSNTWGYDPARGERLGHTERWGGVVRQTLGADYWVVEEGLSGRTTVHDDPIEEGRNGKTYLLPCLLSHAPLDLVAILLGTNDLKQRFGVPASDVARGACALAQLVLKSETGVGGSAPKVLIICPPPFAPLSVTDFGDMFGDDGEAKSFQLAASFKRATGLLNIPLLLAGDVMKSSPIDAIHWEASEHRKLGEAVAARIREMIG